MKEKVYKAVEYASNSNRLENNNLSDSELKEIVDNIMVGKSDESFLLSVVESVKKEPIKVEEEKQNVKIRKWNIKL